nr:muconolactone Delta-isomerase family protein [Amycolatopsis jejuensis]
MLFLAHMEVTVPAGLDPAVVADLLAREKARAVELQREGCWRELWRVAGRFANVSVFEVGSVDRLHEILASLPMFPYLDITVTALATHPSKVD